MPDFRDLALEDLAHDYAILENELVDALQDGATYRLMLQITLAECIASQAALTKTRQRVLQLMGVESLTPENEIGA